MSLFRKKEKGSTPEHMEKTNPSEQRKYTVVMNDEIRDGHRTVYAIFADDLEFMTDEHDVINWLNFTLVDGTTVAAFNAGLVFAVYC